MSATSEKLVEQINELEVRIVELQSQGQSVESLLEQKKILSQKLRQTVEALNESKVLKG